MQQNIEEIKEAILVRNLKYLRQLFRTLEPADIAEIIGQVDFVDSVILFRLVPNNRKAQIFGHLPLSRQEEMIEKLPDAILTSVLNEMEAVQRTQLLENLPFEISSRLLLKLNPDERELAWRMLSYPEDSVGRLADPDYITLKPEMTINHALEYIRWNAHEDPAALERLFVTDPSNVYLGEITLSALVTADPPTKKIAEVMTHSHIVLFADEDKEKAVDYLRKYDRTFYPVLDKERKLVGVITADEVFDVAEEEATEDIQQFGGQGKLEETYFETPMFTLFKKRAGWLSVIFFGELFTGTVLKHYDEMITNMRFLVYFIPLIISSGGNSGSQAASLIIRGLAVKEIEMGHWKKIFYREIFMSLCLGIVLGVMGYIRAVTWGQPQYVAVTIFFSLVGVVCFGATLGAMLPLLLQRLKFDPAVSSSPFIASIVDVVGLVILIEVAIIVTKLFNVG